MPRPGAVSTPIRPPCAVTMPWQIERPMPVPTPCGLVVKKGSKIRRLTSGGMPRAVVRDLGDDLAAAAARRARRGGAAAGDLHQRLLRVDEQVEQHLVQLVAVAPDARQAGRHVGVDLDARGAQAVAGKLEGAVITCGRATGPSCGGRCRAMARNVLTIRAQRSAASWISIGPAAVTSSGAVSRSISA